MRKTVDLTGKLDRSEPGIITVEETEITVDTSAKTMLKVMAATQEGFTAESIEKVQDLLFDSKGKKSIEGLGLSFDGLVTLLEAAIDLAMPRAEGEAPTQDTTS